VISTSLRTTFPVSGPEWDYTASASTVVVAHTVPMVSHVRGWRHHVSSIAVATVTHRITWTRADGRERAAETSSASLEIGEAAGWARPITWSWSILTWWKRRQDFGGSVQNSTGRRGDFDGFLVQRSPVHAQTFSGLAIIQYDNGDMKVEVIQKCTSIPLHVRRKLQILHP
jgi:hypothetical protein